MLNCIKKFLCAALLGGVLIFGSGAVEAGIVTDRFPLTCYADHRINTFDGINGRQVGYIDANVDWITITEYRDGWVKASYNGLRNPQNNPRWFRVTEVCADPNYSNRSVNVRGSQTVYTTRSSNTKMGSVSNNESVIVMAEVGNRAQILYRLDNGTGYKMGWVPSSAIPSRNTQPVMPSNPLVQPVSRYATIKDGWYKISPLHAPGRLLDVNAASTAVGANIQLWDDASNVSQPNQVFYLKNLGNNWFTLKAGHCDLNVAAANTSGSLRTNIQLASPNANSAAQRWRLVYSTTNGAYYIESAIKDKLAFDCADTGSTNGTNIWLWEYGDVNWNKWRFTPVRAPQVNPTPVSGLKGDVNGDGKVDKTDIEALQKYMVDLPVSINKSNADMNNDGNINAVDLSQLVSKVNSNPSPTPAPTQRQAKQTVPAFNDSGLSQRTGNERVDAGDMVTVLQETSGTYKVRYPTSNGTKDRWVSKKIFEEPATDDFDWPVPGHYTISQTYYSKTGSKHSCRYYSGGRGATNTTPWGIDISVPIGTEIHAPASGVVQNKGNTGSTSFGKWFEILHDDGTITLYAHLNDHSMVWNGKRVNKGDLIAKSGNTGGSSGPHLHFEMSNRDTYQYFKGKGIIK